MFYRVLQFQNDKHFTSVFLQPWLLLSKWSFTVQIFHILTGFRIAFSTSAFRHTLKAYKTSSEEGLLRGHSTINVGFALLCEAGESSNQAGQETLCHAEVCASRHLQWEQWVWSKRFAAFYCKELTPQGNLLPCQNVFSKIGLQPQLLCSCKRNSEACSPTSCLLQLQKPLQYLGVKDTMPHAAHWQGAPALSQQEKWVM